MTDQSDRTPNNNKLETIDRATLTPLVRRALARESCEVIDWNHKPLHGGVGEGEGDLSGIYRFTGTGRDKSESVPWSLILKVIGSQAHGGDPEGGTRERLVYQSGMLNELSGGLVAARCYDVVAQEDGSYWLWLEEVVGEMKSVWSLEQYGLAARHLGQFNGTYLTAESLPDWPWLSRDWLRTLITPNAAAIAQLGDVLDHPLVSRSFPTDVAQGQLRLWAEREIFLAALDRLPQTLCHRDAFSRNLFLRRDGQGRDQTVAVDWAFVGPAAVGEEIVPLVQASLAFFEVELRQALRLDQVVFNKYVEGLREAGWQGDPQLVRLGYTASSALRYGLGFIATILLDRMLNFDESKAAWVQHFWGVPIETLGDHNAEQCRLLLALADEARILIDSVG